MKKIISLCMVTYLILLSGCGTVSSKTQTSDQTMNQTADSEVKEIVDMAGRTVTIPVEVKSVFGVNNNASIFLYTLVPELMIGWNSSLSEKCEDYIDSDVYDLPALGTLYGNSNEVNVESIIAKDPDIIVFAEQKIDDDIIKAANQLEQKLSIPVVIVNGAFKQYDKAYEFMGEVLGYEERADKLASYCKETYNLAEEVNNMYALETPVSVYYGSGDNGLSTVAKGTSQSTTIDMLGALNVVNADNINADSGSINLEELISIDPEIIILGNSGFSSGNLTKSLSSAEGWNTLTAVKAGKVYKIPQLPFNWFDKPPSVNRIIGIHWLISVLYSEFENEDIISQTQEYFKLFYHVNITEKQINNMLGL